MSDLCRPYSHPTFIARCLSDIYPYWVFTSGVFCVRHLCDRRQVVVSVVAHHQSAEQDGHDTGQVDTLHQGM